MPGDSAARINYSALDRPDLQQASRCLAAHMSRPLKRCCILLERVARYLQGRRKCVQAFPFERASSTITTYADSDWAGCRLTRKSTSGGAIFLGSSMLRSWSSVQSSIALSSGEAELYALTKAATHTKFIISLAAGFAMKIHGLVKSDNSAALAISQRSGLAGRTRHIQLQYLWLQGEVARQALQVSKVNSAEISPTFCQRR